MEVYNNLGQKLEVGEVVTYFTVRKHSKSQYIGVIEKFNYYENGTVSSIGLSVIPTWEIGSGTPRLTSIQHYTEVVVLHPDQVTREMKNSLRIP